jgi:hypothetical protein
MAVTEKTLQTAECLLRKNWTELIRRLDPLPVADELYERKILGQCNMESIKNASQKSRHEGARELLHLMLLRSWEDAVAFSGILAQIPGIQDLGERMLFLAGIRAEEPSDIKSLIQDRDKWKRAARKGQMIELGLRINESPTSRERVSFCMPQLWTRGPDLPESCSPHLRVISVGNSLLAADDRSGQFFEATTDFSKGEDLGEWQRHDKSRDDKLIRLFTASDRRILALVENRQDKICKLADFNIRDCSWDILADLPEPHQVAWASAAVLGEDRLYLAGGRNHESNCPVDTVHCMDLNTLQWWPLHPMPSHRYSCSLVFMGHRLFVAGGASVEDGTLTSSSIIQALSLDDEQ